MKRILATLVLISILIGCTFCSKSEPDPNDLPIVPEGYIRASVDLQVEENESVNTRATATEENAYDRANVWLLMFNATSASDATPTTLVQAPVKSIESGNKLYALLRATTQPVTVYVMAGLSPAMNAYLQTASNFQEGITTFSTVNNQLQTTAVTSNGVPVGPGVYFPMSSTPFFYSTGTIPLTSITSPLIRSVAKIDVDASAVSSDFTLEGVTLINASQKGFVLAQSAIPANNGGVIQYNEKTAVSSNKLTSEIYLYENADVLSNGTTANPTILIIKGKYKGGESSYYRMDLLKNNGDETYSPYAIRRNFCYTLNIEDIQNGGYRTFTEAKDNEPSNTKYTIIVTDPYSRDIVSNGHYYLGLSNSEFVIYGDAGQIANRHITTVTTDAPAGTYTSINVSAGITAITTSLTPTTGAVTTTQIYATLSETLNEGYIDLRVGNLTKRITVLRKPSIICEDGQKTDFAATEYKTGEVVSGMEWVRLASVSNADFGPSPVKLINPSGGIYIRYNSMLDMNVSRSAELYISKANDQGRTKVLLFASAIRFMSSTIPDNVDKNGMDINGLSQFSATFSNPGNYPFKAAIATGSTLLMETASTTATVKSIDLDGIKVTGGSVTLPRPLSLTYTVNGISFTTSKNFQQRALLTVRILSVGGNAININNGTSVNYGTQLGPAAPNNHYTDAIGKMLYAHTGSGKPISNGFELFNLSEGPNNGNGPSVYNNIGAILRNNNIDILFCSINQGSGVGTIGPNAAQTQEILSWLDENPYRGLIFITDYPDNAELTKAIFGMAQISSGGTDPYSKLPSSDPYYNNPVYKAIMQGSYSTTYSAPENPIDLRETTFLNTAGGNAYGGVPLSATNSKGFIPIFYVTIASVQYVLFTVHPERNIVMMGDINWFTSAQGFANSDGSLTATLYGNYPKMIMNMWEWYINSVALGQGQ